MDWNELKNKFQGKNLLSWFYSHHNDRNLKRTSDVSFTTMSNTSLAYLFNFSKKNKDIWQVTCPLKRIIKIKLSPYIRAWICFKPMHIWPPMLSSRDWVFFGSIVCFILSISFFSIWVFITNFIFIFFQFFTI